MATKSLSSGQKSRSRLNNSHLGAFVENSSPIVFNNEWLDSYFSFKVEQRYHLRRKLEEQALRPRPAEWGAKIDLSVNLIMLLANYIHIKLGLPEAVQHMFYAKISSAEPPWGTRIERKR